jgi:hypothetical protein
MPLRFLHRRLVQSPDGGLQLILHLEQFLPLTTGPWTQRQGLDFLADRRPQLCFSAEPLAHRPPSAKVLLRTDVPECKLKPCRKLENGNSRLRKEDVTLMNRALCLALLFAASPLRVPIFAQQQPGPGSAGTVEKRETAIPSRKHPDACDVPTVKWSGGGFLVEVLDNRRGFFAGLANDGASLRIVFVVEPRVLPRAIFKMAFHPADSAVVDRLRVAVGTGALNDVCVPIRFWAAGDRLKRVEIQPGTHFDTLFEMLVQQDQQSTRKWQSLIESHDEDKLKQTVEKFEQIWVKDPGGKDGLVFIAVLEATRERLAKMAGSSSQPSRLP